MSTASTSPTKYRDITSPTCECREHERTDTISVANGRSYCYITCPFCEAEVKAYIWSLSGGRKRCDCGALHTVNHTYKKKESNQ
jgi:hypothetical protein